MSKRRDTASKRRKRLNREHRKLERARIRVEAAWTFVTAVRPELLPEGKAKLAKETLELCDGFDAVTTQSARLQITAAQVTGIIWGNSQCIHRNCPMLLFADRIAAELNEFFNPSD